MCATVSSERVQSPTCAPSRAEANAASQPACPAPITMTSKWSFITRVSFADTKAREDVCQHIVGRALSGDLFYCVPCSLQIGEQEFFRKKSGTLDERLARSHQRLVRTLDRKSTRLNSSHLGISYAV